MINSLFVHLLQEMDYHFGDDLMLVYPLHGTNSFTTGMIFIDSPRRDDIHRFTTSEGDIHRFTASGGDIHRFTASGDVFHRFTASGGDIHRFTTSMGDIR